MQITFLPSSARDLAWFRTYYKTVFPEGGAKAQQQFIATKQLLAANPYIGRQSGVATDVRKLTIARTPFLLVYRVTATNIEVLRLWDSRQGEG